MLYEKLEIRCPKCQWQPDGEAHWGCICGHFWNTFDTVGVCPSCDKKWETTQCPGCQKWSNHEDWYILPIDFNELLFYKEDQETKKSISKNLHQKIDLDLDLASTIKEKKICG